MYVQSNSRAKPPRLPREGDDINTTNYKTSFLVVLCAIDLYDSTFEKNILWWYNS